MPARLLLAVVLMVAAVSLPVSPVTAAPSTGLVISQVYGGGGNTGAPVRNDYVELFNRGTTAVALGGRSLQYASAAGNFNTSTAQLTDLPNATIPAGGYFLVGEASGANTAVPLVSADFTDPTPINMSAAAGKVALVSDTTPLNCGPDATACAAASARIIDLVGYGTTATYFEGSGPAPAPSATTADVRADAGCTDTDQNATDFATGAVSPRNQATAANPCGGGGGDAAPAVTASTPSAATPAPAGVNPTVTFSEPVDVTSMAFAVTCVSSGEHALSVSGGPSTFTLDPATDFSAGESCTLTVRAAQVSDQDAIDPPDQPVANYTASFSIVAAPSRIHDVQGATHRSPMAGLQVSVEGIVTAVRSNGFYLEDPLPDADPATSEGILVFTSTAPSIAVGDRLSVGGAVVEFRPGGAASDNLSTTEITGPTLTVLSGGNPLPLTDVGPGGRVPPAQVIEDDATGDVETSGTFDPASDGIDFYESLEGMRLRVVEPKVVGPTSRFGELAVVPGGGAFGGLFTPRGGILLRPDDTNPERILLDDAILAVPVADVGDTLSAPPVGVLDYTFGNFKLEITQALTAAATGPAPEVGALPAANELAVANFNVENLDPGDSLRIPRQAAQIVDALRSPDVLALQEIQDNNGATNDAVTDASASAGALIDAIVTAGGPRYTYVDINPVDDQDGGEPGGNIRVGYLYREDRGLRFVARPGGTPTSATTVVAGAGGPTLSASPGRIDPTNSAFNSSRKPLAAEFTYRGQRLFVINNHFNSKGGDDPLFGRVQPPVRSSEVQRHQQAQIVNDFVKQILAVDSAARVVVAGDLNDFDFSRTLEILTGSELTDLIGTLPADERYDYVFEGNSQVLDHVLTSSSLVAKTTLDVVHVNAEYVDQTSDHDPELALLKLVPPPPACTVTAVRRPGPSGSAEQDVTVTDAAGLTSIEGVQITNGRVFTAGSSGTRIDDQASTPLAGEPTSLVLTAVKTTAGVATKWSFDATDTAGNRKHCE